MAQPGVPGPGAMVARMNAIVSARDQGRVISATRVSPWRASTRRVQARGLSATDAGPPPLPRTISDLFNDSLAAGLSTACIPPFLVTTTTVHVRGRCELARHPSSTVPVLPVDKFSNPQIQRSYHCQHACHPFGNAQGRSRRRGYCCRRKTHRKPTARSEGCDEEEESLR